MSFPSDPISVIREVEYEKHKIVIMDVLVGFYCDRPPCKGVDLLPDEPDGKCPGCGRPAEPTTEYVAMVDGESLQSYYKPVEGDTEGAIKSAIEDAKKFIDQLEEAKKQAAIPRLTGKQEASAPVARDPSEYDPEVLNKITAQGKVLGWGLMLAALAGVKVESSKDAHLPRPRR